MSGEYWNTNPKFEKKKLWATTNLQEFETSNHWYSEKIIPNVFHFSHNEVTDQFYSVCYRNEYLS